MSAHESISQGRAIAYLRCSTTDQKESLPSQLEWSIRRARELNVGFSVTKEDLELALSNGVTHFGDLYFDSGVTGADMKRPGFLAFKNRAVEDATVTDVLLWSRDRFARPEDAEEAMGMEKLILFAGTNVHVAQGHSLRARTRGQHHVSDDFLLLVEYGIAGSYRVDLSSKVLRGQARNARAGRTNGGRAPYGMRRAILDLRTNQTEILEDGEYRNAPGIVTVIAPGESAEDLGKLDVVREIHDLYAKDHGLSKIARILNERLIPSPDSGRKRKSRATGVDRTVSGKWNLSNIRGVLEQPLYKGVHAWARTAVGDLRRFDEHSPEDSRELSPNERLSRTAKAKRVVKRDRVEWLTATPALEFPPVVDPDLWDSNNDKLRERGVVGGLRGTKRCRDANRYPLTVVCGACGQPMSGTPKYGQFAYICSTYSNSHGSACSHNWCERDVAVGFALRAIRNLVSDKSAAESLRAILREMAAEEALVEKPSAIALAGIEGRLDELELARRKADRDRRLAADEIEREDAHAFYRQCVDETRVAKNQLTMLRRQAKHAVPTDLEAEVQHTMALLGEIEVVAQEAAPDTLRAMFAALGVTLTIKYEKGRVGKRLNLPVSAEIHLRDLGELGKVGRGERIRTSDLCNPIAAR